MSSLFSLNSLLSRQKSSYVGNGVPERVHCLPISAIRRSQISPSQNWGMHRSLLASVADQTWRSDDPNSGWCLKAVDTRVNPDATAKNSSTTSLVLPKLETNATLYRLPVGGKIYDVSEISSGGKPLMRAIGGQHKGSSSSYFALLEPEPPTYGKGNRPNSLCAIGMSEKEYRQAFSVIDNTAPGAVSQRLLDWHPDPKFEKSLRLVPSSPLLLIQSTRLTVSTWPRSKKPHFKQLYPRKHRLIPVLRRVSQPRISRSSQAFSIDSMW